MRNVADAPKETVRRLLFYLRQLDCMLREGKERFSSEDLAEVLHVNPAQIRKDLSYFGEFGTRGVGYDTGQLATELRSILNLDKHWEFVLVGAGNIGEALLRNPELRRQGFRIVMAFDKNPKVIGKKIGGVTVEDVADITERVREAGIRLAIIAVSVESAQEVGDSLIEAGVEGILCFAPCYLTVPKTVRLVPIDIAMELGLLVYRL
jgi:redox-sensing transcriptional repressor